MRKLRVETARCHEPVLLPVRIPFIAMAQAREVSELVSP
jgi:hypothetical protein